MISDDDMRRLVSETVNQVLDDRNRLDSIRHQADHDFIFAWREREQRRQELWVSVRKNVIAFLVVSALTFLGALIWSGWENVNGNHKPPFQNNP